VFWDIENVPIPAGLNAFDIVKQLRQQFIEDRNLVQGSFTAYGNIRNIPPNHQQGLKDAHVDIPLILDVKIGAADRVIFWDLLKFKSSQKTPTTVMLLSGDKDFTDCVNELRYQHRHHVIVVHRKDANHTLLKTANETLLWEKFTHDFPRINHISNMPNVRKEGEESKTTVDNAQRIVGKSPARSHGADNKGEPAAPPKIKPLMDLDGRAVSPKVVDCSDDVQPLPMQESVVCQKAENLENERQPKKKQDKKKRGYVSGKVLIASFYR
jgi:hypothetical protein